jgi:hypothetical protein
MGYKKNVINTLSQKETVIFNIGSCPLEKRANCVDMLDKSGWIGNLLVIKSNLF